MMNGKKKSSPESNTDGKKLCWFHFIFCVILFFTLLLLVAKEQLFQLYMHAR